MAATKKDFGLIIWAFGWLLGVADAIRKATKKLDVPFDAFECLGSPKGVQTIERIVLLVRDDWQAEQSKLVMQPDYFTPLSDVEAVALLVESRKYTEEVASAIVGKYRKLATEHGVPATTPICYRVQAGFMLKTHAPKAGHCYQSFYYLQGRDFKDTATSDSIVFWVPRILNSSTSQTKMVQLDLLFHLRKTLELPAHHLNGFGSVGLVAGLILAHFKVTGERIPSNSYYVRTDTRDADGNCLGLGNFDGAGLLCTYWHCDAKAFGSVGAFALGWEALGS